MTNEYILILWREPNLTMREKLQVPDRNRPNLYTYNKHNTNKVCSAII